MAYRAKWLPTQPDTADNWATALFLERDYWENMGGAVAQGIAKAFNN